MNIASILTLDDGVSGISCSGTATYVKEAINKTGEYDGRPYDFWAQFVVIKDATGDIGVHLNLGNNDFLAAKKGERVSVERGVVKSYKDEKGNLRKSLRAYLADGEKQKEAQPPPQRPAPNKPPAQSQAKNGDLRNTSSALACAEDLVARGIIDFAQQYTVAKNNLYFLDTGKIPNGEPDQRVDDDEPQGNEPEIPF